MYQVRFLRNTKLVSFGLGSFLTLSAAGRARGPPVHHGASVGPAWVRGACSGHSKSRNLASNRGIAFRPARATPETSSKQKITPQQLPMARQPRLTAALQDFSFATTVNGASACGFVSVRVCACVHIASSSYISRDQEHNCSRAVFI